jgi:hypothetical protein
METFIELKELTKIPVPIMKYTAAALHHIGMG